MPEALGGVSARVVMDACGVTCLLDFVLVTPVTRAAIMPAMATGHHTDGASVHAPRVVPSKLSSAGQRNKPNSHRAHHIWQVHRYGTSLAERVVACNGAFWVVPFRDRWHRAPAMQFHMIDYPAAAVEFLTLLFHKTHNGECRYSTDSAKNARSLQENGSRHPWGAVYTTRFCSRLLAVSMRYT